jgi:AraC family transcriptional activator of pobA
MHIHPDFLLSTSLAGNIRKYGFFSYDVNEALCLSEKEKAVISGIFESIKLELSYSIDNFSQDIIISQIEQLLNYSNRYYNRQFITRKAVHSNLLTRLDNRLAVSFDQNEVLQSGMLSVNTLADELQVSARYLSDMLKSLTGMTTQQYIQGKMIDKAKEMLSVSSLSISEIAYALGFEHPQSFNKIFKRRTNLSPLEFRQSFN